MIEHWTSNIVKPIANIHHFVIELKHPIYGFQRTDVEHQAKFNQSLDKSHSWAEIGNILTQNSYLAPYQRQFHRLKFDLLFAQNACAYISLSLPLETSTKSWNRIKSINSSFTSKQQRFWCIIYEHKEQPFFIFLQKTFLKKVILCRIV